MLSAIRNQMSVLIPDVRSQGDVAESWANTIACARGAIAWTSDCLGVCTFIEVSYVPANGATPLQRRRVLGTIRLALRTQARHAQITHSSMEQPQIKYVMQTRRVDAPHSSSHPPRVGLCEPGPVAFCHRPLSGFSRVLCVSTCMRSR